MSIFSHFKTDTLLETEGVEIDYLEFKLSLRRAGGANKKYSLAFSDAAKAHKNKGHIDAQIKNDVMLDAFVKGCYVEHSWYTRVETGKDEQGNPVYEYQRGIHNEKLEVIPGTLQNVRAVLKQLPDLFEALLLQAQDIDLFKRQQTEAAAEALKA